MYIENRQSLRVNVPSLEALCSSDVPESDFAVETSCEKCQHRSCDQSSSDKPCGKELISVDWVLLDALDPRAVL